MIYKAPRGTKDILPSDSYKWQFAEEVIRDQCRRYGFNEIRTPIFEQTEVFVRGVGDTTDVVSKEMYTFEDKGGRSMTLRPEGTAGVVRSLIENNINPLPLKLYYLSAPMFRYENPQAGRQRQFHQFGIEVFGASDASVDAETIALAWDVLKNVGVGNLELNINSIGCPECRPAFREKLIAYFEDRKDELCPTCRERLYKNPLRILDCKEEKCREICSNAPVITDNLCPDCQEHFEDLKAYLKEYGIPYVVNPFIVRGLDYYTKTVFEIISGEIGAQGTVCGGGRYDGLVSQLGGQDICGIGFGMGMERLMMVMEAAGGGPAEGNRPDIFIATMGRNARLKCVDLLRSLREKGFSADMDHISRSMKAQFKYAGKINCRFVGSLGEDELEKGIVKLKNMDTGEEKEVAFDEIAGMLAK
ncbi:MAG: histidine--tRNA ligase [Christensenellaceae bacterium]|nr:histidine--tRNA ligase [Christensenellaceae bacterium]